MLEEVCQSTHRGKFKRGALPFALMERKHVLEIRDELRPPSSPGAQNNVVRAISSLFTWAIETGAAKINPCSMIKMLKAGDGFHQWTEEEVEQYEARHPLGSKARLALHLALFTGLRLSDLAKLGHQHVRNGLLSIRPGKTAGSSAVTVDLPVLPALEETIVASPTGDLNFLSHRLWKGFHD